MNSKIKTAIASYGMSGQVFHGPLLKTHHGYEVKAILERSKNHSLKQFPENLIVREYAEILTNNEIELIIVNTPDHLHFEMVKSAIEAGKHVVVEKPFVQKGSEGDHLIQLANDKNLKLSVFQNRRWDGDFLTVQKIINENQLGRLVEYEAHFDRYRKKANPDTWKESPGYGTGTLYNLGSHMIDQALVLFGLPESVTADIRILRDEGQVDDFFDIWLNYPDVKVTLKGTYLAMNPLPRYTLHGTDGSFQKYGLDPQEERLKMGDLPDPEIIGAEAPEWYGSLVTFNSERKIESKIETIPGNYLMFYENLYQAIRNGAATEVKATEGLNVIKIIEAAIKSHNEKRTIFLHEV